MIPINDLRQGNSAYFEELKDVINHIIENGCYILGSEVKAFENGFASYCGATHCIGVANGTDALELALRALEIKQGDAIATVANAGLYSTVAIQSVGATPLFVEVNPVSMTMDPNSLADTLTANTKAIVVTHLYGQMANLSALSNIAKKANIPLIEDCAQAHGAILHNKMAGNWGTLGCFSFYPTKNLGALGDGGAIVTSTPELAERIYRLRQYGWETKYNAVLSNGRNSRLDEIQAAVLRTKLPHLNILNKQRRKIATIYNDNFKKFEFTLPAVIDESYVGHLYVIRTPHRNKLRELLNNEKISTDIHYPIPDYLQPCIKNENSFQLPITEKCCSEVLTLPCFPQMTDNAVEQVITAVNKAMNTLSLSKNLK